MLPTTDLNILRRMRELWSAGVSDGLRAYARSEYNGNANHFLWAITHRDASEPTRGSYAEA